MDKGILKEEQISIGSGVRYTTVIMRCADLLRALDDVELGEFAAKNDESS